MKNFLKTKEVLLGDEKVNITQLSGLERFDFLDYCTDLPKPEQPEPPGENATQLEKEKYLEEMSKNIKQWQRINFMGQSRLVAYGYKESDEDKDLDERHQQIMSSMTPDQVKLLHDEIAKFSGIPLPEPVEDTDENEPEETQEPADPKG